jgi:regulator of sigma E protease
VPLGGYVKIAGMIDESMDTEQMKQEPKEWEFRSKPAWQRLIVMIGGVTVNFFLAWIIYTGLLYTNGDSYIPADSLKYGILVDSVGQKIGLQTGDQILAIDGKKAKKFTDASLDILLGDDITVNRNGQKVTFPIPPKALADVLKTQGRNFLTYRRKAILDTILPNKAAEKVGLQKGDEIVAVDNQAIEYWNELFKVVQSSANEKLNLSIKRNGALKNIDITVGKDSTIGVGPGNMDLFVTDEYDFLASIPAGYHKTIEVLTKQVRQFKIIFNTDTQAYKSVKGPIGIVSIMPEQWRWGFFWNFLAMFSVWLAFVNLLPIPALDGGHVMFLLYEMISGRPPSETVLERGQIVGFIIVMGLMAVVFGNDIWNLIKDYF